MRPLVVSVAILSWGLCREVSADVEVDVQRAASELGERLTEREDENRVDSPWTILLFGHPLSARLQLELSIEGTRQISEDDPPENESRALLVQETEAELFYTIGPQLSLFAQGRVGMEVDVVSETRRGVSDVFVERGEMWLYSQPIPGYPISLELGRLDFEDDRRWWWDDDLDALRVTAGGEPVELAVALAWEVAPTRSDHGYIEPEDEHALRVLAEASWDWAADHTLALFGLYQGDHSQPPEVGALVNRARQDDSIATLTWLGARATGALTRPSLGVFGYWIDAAWVGGRERFLDLEPVSSSRSVVDAVVRRDVGGWAIDLGATWIAPVVADPRLTLGYAWGSGDPNPNDRHDRAFRQTGLHANEPGFGGYERFRAYGQLLDPDLSNLGIVTAGAGVSILTSSSVDLVYHYYRQVEATDSLADARLEALLTGRSRDVGHGLDLVLALEEWDHVEVQVSASAFRAGEAFGTKRGRWALGGFAALRLAF